MRKKNLFHHQNLCCNPKHYKQLQEEEEENIQSIYKINIVDNLK